MDNQRPLVELSSSIGDFIEYWGFRAIDGRVWSLIYLSDIPISTPEIVKTLNVSKALVSIAINELLNYELIIHSEKVANGAQTYCANMDIAKVIRNVLKERELNKLKETEACLDSFSRLSKKQLEDLNISSAKLRDISELTKLHRSVLDKLVNKKTKSLGEWIKFLKRCIRFI